jgi:hypothetical protein
MEVIQIHKEQIKHNKLVINLPKQYQDSDFEGYLILNKKNISYKELLKLSGKLMWDGDAVAEQRKLRDY